MAGSPMFSVNFRNPKNSVVLNYHKSWSWSNQPVLWDFYIMFLLVSIFGCSLLFIKHAVTGDVWRHNVLTFHTASAENRRKKSPRVGWVCCFCTWNTLQHYLVDVIMKEKSFFVQRNLNFALMYRNNIEFYSFFAIEWTAKFTENIGLSAI